MKKNFNKLPIHILERVNVIEGEVIVAVVKKYSATEITKGALKHFGILSIKDLEADAPPNLLPVEEAGRYSKVNVLGKVITRRDLPKVLKTIDCGSRPIFGDYNKGSFTLYIDRLVYPKEFLPPKKLTITIQLIQVREENDEMNYVFRIAVGQPLNKSSSSFEKDLLFNVNLLQENVGGTNVFDANAPVEEYLNTVTIDWEILPVGSSDEILRKITSRYRKSSPEIISTIQERYDFLIGLHPEKFIFCDTGLKRYFGAMFSENFVVFENMQHGNAIYIMFEEWQVLSKLSRTELKEFHQGKFIWIQHSDNWKGRLIKEINLRLGRNE